MNEVGWRNIKDAPRDGQTIEVRCDHTVSAVPWYGLFRWDVASGREGRWRGVPDASFSFTEDVCFTWRYYTGRVADYRDPLGGRQMTAEDWSYGAAARLGRLPEYPEPKEKSPWRGVVGIVVLVLVIVGLLFALVR